MIKKLLILLAILYKVSTVYGAENIAGSSAYISDVNDLSVHEYNLKRNAITKVLSKYESPLIQNADAFVETCLKYDINCYLLPSISGLESTFGRFGAGTFDDDHDKRRRHGRRIKKQRPDYENSSKPYPSIG